MSPAAPDAWITIGSERFAARLERDRAPAACAQLEAVTPCSIELIHARWSGEACWAPLAAIWPAGLILPEEQATDRPAPGQILLYAGPLSEPELLVPYGAARFASRAGALAGSPVMTIEDDLARLAEVGRQVLWGGAMAFGLEILS